MNTAIFPRPQGCILLSINSLSAAAGFIKASLFDKFGPSTTCTPREYSCFPLARCIETNSIEKHLAASPYFCKMRENISMSHIDRKSNVNSSKASNNISKFYEGSTILITGATGFVGKVLLEKLLRSCNSLESVYLLMRPKKGLSVEQRLDELLRSPLFHSLRKNNVEQLKKVKPLHGDVGHPNLGLSPVDRCLLTDTVNVVFHSAATIRFMGDVHDAITINTIGTRDVAELCKDMKNLQSFIHVSTAFFDLTNRDCDEVVYDAAYDPSFIMNLIAFLPPDFARELTPKLLKGEYVNTYTLSKWLAENVVLEYSKILPVAIVRPALVNSSWREPFPGWVDSLASVTAVTTGIVQGTSRSILGNTELTLDLIPVDVVANTIIAAAWHTATYKKDTMRVYTCTSRQINDLTLGFYNKAVVKYARKFPTRDVLFYPGCKCSTSWIVHEIRKALLHYMPAYILDSYLYVTGRKPKLVFTCKMTTKAMKNFDYMLLCGRTFRVSNFKSLVAAVKEAEDGKDFDIDITSDNGFDWDEYLKNNVLGVRQYILKDDIASLDKARAKLNRLHWATRGVQILSVSAAAWLAFW